MDHTQSDIDLRTQQACAKVKAAGIELWTIRVIDGNASLLQACATQPSSTYYKNVQDAAQLNDVFADIAKALTNLRIARVASIAAVRRGGRLSFSPPSLTERSAGPRGISVRYQLAFIPSVKNSKSFKTEWNAAEFLRRPLCCFQSSDLRIATG